VKIDRPRYDMSRDARKPRPAHSSRRFTSGDAAAVSAVVGEGATLQADGGGRVTTYPKMIAGVEKLIRLFQG
jgi:RNA polymerase sigma-70 factor (ECF subfamily)